MFGQKRQKLVKNFVRELHSGRLLSLVLVLVLGFQLSRERIVQVGTIGEQIAQTEAVKFYWKYLRFDSRSPIFADVLDRINSITVMVATRLSLVIPVGVQRYPDILYMYKSWICDEFTVN